MIGFLFASIVSQSRADVELYADAFENDLSLWVIEQESGGGVSLKEGELDINVPGGCTVWFKTKLSGSIRISFEATMIDQGGENDRVSDLNCFWMASSPKFPEDIFSGEARMGRFKNYNPLQLYYVGLGGGGNSTTRFRRYPGDGTRPLLTKHDLDEPLLIANQTVSVEIVTDGHQVQYWYDGELVFDIYDPEPFRSGWFAFRTLRSHLRIDDFQVWQLPE